MGAARSADCSRLQQFRNTAACKSVNSLNKFWPRCSTCSTFPRVYACARGVQRSLYSCSFFLMSHENSAEGAANASIALKSLVYFAQQFSKLLQGAARSAQIGGYTLSNPCGPPGEGMVIITTPSASIAHGAWREVVAETLPPREDFQGHARVLPASKLKAGRLSAWGPYKVWLFGWLKFSGKAEIALLNALPANATSKWPGQRGVGR